MNYAQSPKLIAYDTMTEAGVVALADHVPEYGTLIYSQVDNVGSATNASTSTFTASKLQPAVAAAEGKGLLGTKVVPSSAYKKIAVEFENLGTASFLTSFVGLFMPDIVSTNADDYADILKLTVTSGVIGKLINLSLENPSGTAGVLINAPANVNHGITSDKVVMIVELVGTIIRAYITAAPDKVIEYDTADDSRIDISNLAFYINADNSADNNSNCSINGVSIEG